MTPARARVWPIIDLPLKTRSLPASSSQANAVLRLTSCPCNAMIHVALLVCCVLRFSTCVLRTWYLGVR